MLEPPPRPRCNRKPEAAAHDAFDPTLCSPEQVRSEETSLSAYLCIDAAAEC